ncbi:MAG TPA: PAS domain S-box protein, partial [Candidatus Udaeobacter sp.]|nr:PAS domain S-box protein [Candidatus Udaeobacter sp.]
MERKQTNRVTSKQVNNGADTAANDRPKPLLRRDALRYPKTALEQATRRYVDLFDFAPIGYVTFDRVGRIEEINFAAIRLVGRPREQLVGSTFAVCVVKKDMQLFLHHLHECGLSDEPVVTELQLQRPNGETAIVQLSSTPSLALMKDGARLYQTAIIDLTEHKIFEEKIQRSEERYRTLFNLVPVAVFICDADGIIQEHNRRAAVLWGYEPGRHQKRPKFCGSHKIRYPDGRLMPHKKCPLARALRGEKLEAKDLEIIVERPNGERRHVIPAPRILTNPEGKITGAINCLFDITDHKQAEIAAMRLAAVVQSSRDAIAAKTVTGIVTDWNQSAERIFGYKASEIVGKSILTVIPKERHSEEQEILRTIRDGKSLDHYETVRCRKDGKLIDVSLTISPIKGPKGEILGVSKIARDITEQKQAQRRLAEQARLLDLTHDAIIVRDHQDRIAYWNRGAEEMYGFSAKEALGKVTHDLLQTAHAENLDVIQKRLQRDNYWSGELMHTRKDGKAIVVYSRWNLDRDACGRSLSILETNSDISARKQAEQQRQTLYRFSKAQHSATKIAEIYEAALDAIVFALGCQRASILLFDTENVMRFVAWRGLSERYRKAVEGHSPWNRGAKNPRPVCMTDVDTADIPRPLKATIRREHIRAAAFIPLVSGRKLIGKFMAYYDMPHLFTDDELKLATTLATQLAQAVEQKRDEEAVKQKEAELEQIVTQTPFMLTRCTRDLHYRYVSRAYAEMFNRRPEQFTGKAIVEIIGKEALTKISPYIEKVLKGDRAEYEMEVPFRAVGARWINCVYVPDKDADGNVVGWVASLIDVGLRKQAELTLEKS